MAAHDRSTYEKDLAALIKNQTDIIKQQVLLEIITIACNCDDFKQFKGVLYARALGMKKQFEDQGMLEKKKKKKAAKCGKIDESKAGK